MAKETNKQIAIAIPGEWAFKKVLGPILDEIGSDLQTLYKNGREAIISATLRKIDPDDGKQVNLRVTRDVFWNGSFTDEAICAEYFGGILASSRSTDGKDDRGVYYTDIIKSLSSQQLRFHYLIYFALNKLWLGMPPEKERPNVGLDTDLHNYTLWLADQELEAFGIDFEKDAIAIANKGLIIPNYEAKFHKIDEKHGFPYAWVKPSSLGIQLYAVAHNKLADWRKLPIEDFGKFEDIKTPNFFTLNLADLVAKVTPK